MKKFLKKAIFFIIPILLIAIFLEIYLRKVKNIYEQKAQQLVENSSKINVLILGNSHSTYGVDPSQFNLFAFNAAQVSQSIYFDKRITLKYLDQLKKLKYVFISVDFHSLYFSSQNIRNDWSYYGYKIRYKNRQSAFIENCYLKGYTPKLAVVSFINFISQKKIDNKFNALDLEEGVDLKKHLEKGYFSYKYIPNRNTNFTDFESEKRALKFKNIVQNSKENKEILNDLEDFIIKLQIKNIIPILFTSPCNAAYVQFLDANIQKQNQKDINFLTNKYKIEYWNYLQLPLQQSDFHDCDHLNAVGARKFSKILNNRLNSLSKK